MMTFSAICWVQDAKTVKYIKARPSHEMNVRLNFMYFNFMYINGSNIFEAMKICPRRG